MPTAINNEEILLAQVAEGNEKAFRQLFDYYWQNVYGVAFAMTKSSVISEEIVQEVFLKIWLKRDKLGAVHKFDGYLFMVARNHIYNVLRQKTAEQPFAEHLEEHFLETSALPEEQMMLKETKQLINLAVQQLSPQQRAVFELSRNEGFDHEKIAKKLGISRLTVKSHMTKALQSIRQYLQTHTEVVLPAFIISLILL